MLHLFEYACFRNETVNSVYNNRDETKVRLRIKKYLRRQVSSPNKRKPLADPRKARQRT